MQWLGKEGGESRLFMERLTEIHTEDFLKEIYKEICKIWSKISLFQHIYSLIDNMHPVIYQKNSIGIIEYML